ncbi:MAG TPA: hypothetical protein PKW76_09110 [bacterium]|nr:hypothetical protein [bacterium]HPG45827.1 hypothetical protein [bacterium]HPM97946.1 hypothetical protein [bacterium]
MLFCWLCIALFSLQIASHVNGFDVPESDFFDYRQQAVELRNLSWPEQFKRPPLFQSAVAMVSLVFQGPARELTAAELIIAVSAVLSLLLVYRIARHYLGDNGFWAAWLWAFHPVTLRMAIKPKPEFLVTLLILWAVDRFIRKDRRAYLIAFFATMVRYEGALAIAAFVLTDLIFSRKRLITIGLGALSGSFIVVWTLIQQGGSGGASYGNYFSDYRFNIEYLRTFWVGMLNAFPVQGFKIWTALALLFSLLGAIAGLRRQPRTTVMGGIFLAGFVFMHMIWPFSNIDYTVIVSWIVLIAIVGGFSVAVDFAGNKLRSMGLASWNSSTSLIAVAFAVLLAVSVFLIRHRFAYPQYNIDIMAVAIAVLVMAGFLWHQSDQRIKTTAVAGLILAALLAFYLNSQTQADLFDIRYSKAEYRAAAEWFASHRRAGDRMAIDQPVIAAFYTDLDPDRDLVRLADLPSLEPAELAAWLKENDVCTIAWLSTHRLLNRDDNWYRWKRDNRGWQNVTFLEAGQDLPDFDHLVSLTRGPRIAHIYRVCN